MYMLCMKYLEIQAHEVYEMYIKIRISCNADYGILVCNNTHGKLWKTPFVIFFTPDG
jgi:hypothetical protein